MTENILDYCGGVFGASLGAAGQRPFAMPGDPPLSEWSGQHTYDITNQFIRPRSVVRFQNLADRSRAMVAAMTPATTPTFSTRTSTVTMGGVP